MADVEKYFTYEGRVASFRKTTKKRGSTAGRGAAKPLNWPHKQITPASLAKAGFYFNPSPANPDNCTCFLCQKGLDGWEAGDDPLVEHLTHASHCGWAIITAIEAEIEEYSKQDPTLPRMVEAREATFGTRWPHEGKKGWQCNTKQLVESGWVYTPTDESDDMATCMYCQLALDGWEPSDKPYDEHYKRSPNCAFFTLTSEPEPAPKKAARGKAARASKASRLSTQSVATAVSEISVLDVTAEPEDSVLTTASMAQGKKPRAKKATAKATKGGRKKTKKETTPVDDASDAGDESEVMIKPPPAKATRGRKRGSEAVEDSMMSTASASAPKRRATKTRASAAESSIASEDTAIPDAPAPAKAKGARQSKTRKPSVAVSAAANTSIASLRATPDAFPDDDEIERQLEADLERQLTEDEFVFEYRRPSVPPEAKPASEKKSAAYAMLDPEPAQPDEAEIDDELQALQNEMEVEEPEIELKVPKKGRKAAGTRKVSKQTKAKKAKEPSPSPSPPPPPPVEEPIESEIEEEEDNHSILSTDTVVKTIESSHSTPETRDRRRSRKSSVGSEDSVDMVTLVEQDETPVRRQSHRVSLADASPSSTPSPSPGPDAQLTSEANYAADMNDDDLLATNDDEEMHIAEDPIETATSPIATSLAEPPSTPGHIISPAPSAMQAILSPSPSLQSSDAENQPPSSKPSASTKRIALAPITATPSRMSPSKRNVIAGLQSTTSWSAGNLDAIFGTPRVGVDKENSVERLLKQGKDLSSPEKQMTVEEWIYFNATEAETKLKHDCERMVSLFESEGTRAMNVLEGLAVE